MGRQKFNLMNLLGSWDSRDIIPAQIRPLGQGDRENDFLPAPLDLHLCRPISLQHPPHNLSLRPAGCPHLRQTSHRIQQRHSTPLANPRLLRLAPHEPPVRIRSLHPLRLSDRPARQQSPALDEPLYRPHHHPILCAAHLARRPKTSLQAVRVP